MSLDAVTRMMNTLKNFEKKLDKLQEDVDYQGQTLLDVRIMVMNLSAGNIVSPDAKSEGSKRPRNTTANTYENKENKTHCTPIVDKTHYTPTADRLGRHSGLKSLPTKLNPYQRRRLSSLENPTQNQMRKAETSQAHMQRHRQAEAVRKVNAARLHKKKSERKAPINKVAN